MFQLGRSIKIVTRNWIPIISQPWDRACWLIWARQRATSTPHNFSNAFCPAWKGRMKSSQLPSRAAPASAAVWAAVVWTCLAAQLQEQKWGSQSFCVCWQMSEQRHPGPVLRGHSPAHSPPSPHFYDVSPTFLFDFIQNIRAGSFPSSCPVISLWLQP